jgi:transketolase C-terminal domain/subunit
VATSKRADLLLVERGLAETRTRAQALILSGRVYSDESRIEKAGTRLDSDLIFQWARECRVTLTVEENVLQGGFGSAIIEAASDQGETFTIHRLGLPDSFLEHATLKELRAELKIDADGIGATVKELLSGGDIQKS